MWICQRCNAENRDTFSACEACGAVRAAGRFAPAAQQRASRAAQPPRVTAAAQSQDTPPAPAPAPARLRDSYTAPDPRAARPRKRRGALNALARCAGGALCALLPALTALLAWRQYEALSAALLPLLLGPDAPAWLSGAVYGVFTAAALLLSLLPGLWTLLLARRDN